MSQENGEIVRKRRHAASPGRKRATAIGAAIAFLIVAAFIAACGSSNTAPSVPSGAVAVVEDAPDGTISKTDFDAALTQAAARQGAKKIPAPSDPSYSALHDAAMSDVLLSRWVRGEAAERGVTVSDSEISSQLQQVKKQQFGGEKQFQQFLKQAHFTPQQARDRVELQMISTEIQKQVLAKAKGQAAQRATAEHFQTEFIAKWRSRTSCAPGYAIDRCSNGPPPTTTSTGSTTTPSPGVP